MKHPIAIFAVSRAQRGFSIVAAIFLLVILAGLGAAIVTVATTQQRGAVADLQGTRAYLAARAGMEWGMYNVNINPSTGLPYVNPATQTLFSTSAPRSCPGGSGTFNSFAMPAAATTLSGFTVTVQCKEIDDANGGTTVFQIDAWACSSPTSGWTATSQACPNTGTLPINYVERHMRVFL